MFQRGGIGGRRGTYVAWKRWIQGEGRGRRRSSGEEEEEEEEFSYKHRADAEKGQTPVIGDDNFRGEDGGRESVEEAR